MRYTRLRRQIESGTLIGTHGTPFSGSADKIYQASAKRKRGGGGVGFKRASSGDETEDEMDQVDKVDVDAGREMGGGFCSANGGNRREVGGVKESAKGRGGAKAKGKEITVKEEQQDSDFSSTSNSSEDSEDEMPLAKLRKARLDPLHASGSSRVPSKHQSPSRPYVSPYPSRMMSPGVGGSQFSGGKLSGAVVPISMPQFTFRPGGDNSSVEEKGFARLGSGFHSPFGWHSNSVTAGGDIGSGWADTDWARWQDRSGYNKEVHESACLH